MSYRASPSFSSAPTAATGHMPFGHRSVADVDAAADSRPVAVVRWTEDGEMQLGIFGEGCRMLVIDDRAPHDRVYEITHREPLKALAKLVPPDASIGSAADDRHLALVARMRALFEGRPHLVPVPKGGEP